MQTKTCWYEQVCSKRHFNCQRTCHRFLEMSFLIENCGMPDAEKYIKKLQPCKKDIKAFSRLNEIKSNIVQFVNEGRNLYIYSKNLGNGKTTWGLKILYKYFDEIWCGNGFRVRGLFVYVPSFLNSCKNPELRNNQEFKQLQKNLFEADIVIWDDIASTTLTNNDHINLLTYIDQRMLYQKTNIYTGNLQKEELKEALGERLSSRVWNNSVTVQFFGTDERGKF